MTRVDETTPWRRSHVRGTAAELHALDLGESAAGGRSITVCEVSRPAVVLGSTQGDGDIDEQWASVQGIDIVRRRSGGGAVWLHPVESVWIDLWIPRGDSLWTDDVSASMLFAGEAFVEALTEMLSETLSDERDLRVWRERFEAGPFGRQVCFASDAPGEVRGPTGKAVGISQRRDRRGARLQCVLYRRWSPTEWSGVFVDGDVRRAVEALTVTTVDLDAHSVADRVHAALSRR